MNAFRRRLCHLVGVSIAALVVLGGLNLAGTGVAGQGPALVPSLKLLVSSESGLALPDRLVLGVDAVNNAGDYATLAGGSNFETSFAGGWMMGSNNGTALLLRRASDAAPRLLLQSGDPVPGLPLSAIDVFPGNLYINEDGVVCALVLFQDAVTQYAIVTHDGATLRKVVASSDIDPNSRKVFGRSVQVAGFNDSGDVAFTAPMIPLESLEAAPQTTAFLAPQGETPLRVVGPGDPAPLTGSGTLDQISGVQLNNAGAILFRAAIVSGSDGYGLFVAHWDGSEAVTLRKVVASGDTNPRDGGVFDTALNMNTPRFNDEGQVAFGDAVQLFISTPGQPLALVAAEGTTMPAPLGDTSLSRMTAVGSHAFNSAGQIAFLTTTTDSRQAVLRYTPGTGLEVIAYSGQQAPFTQGATFAAPLGGIQMNGAGDVAFYSRLSPASPAAGGQFKKPDGESLEKVVLDGDQAPDSVGGTYYFTGYAHLLDGGSVYFRPDLKGSAAGSAALILRDSVPPQVVASGNDLLPSGSRVFFRDWNMGGAGGFTMFEARRAGGGDSIWVHDTLTGRTSRVVAEGDPAPVSGGGWLSSVSTVNQGVSRTGQVVFTGTVWGARGMHVLSWSPSTGLTRLAGPGSTAPWTTATFTSTSLTSLLVPPFNDDAVVFRGNLSNGTNGIFLVPRGGGDIAKVVLSTDPAPGGGTFTSGTSTTLNYPYINSAGQVAFWGLTSEGRTGYYIGAANSAPVKVVATGDTAPGSGGGTFSGFALAGPAGFNDLGQAIFFGTVTGGTTGGGLFAGTADGTVVPIALNGTAAPSGGSYAFTSTSRDAHANARGDIVFLAPLNGGTSSSGLFLWRVGTDVCETVALEGQAAPGTGFPFAVFTRNLSNLPGEFLRLGPAGELVFNAGVDEGDRWIYGAFRYSSSAEVSPVVMRGGPRPDGEAGAVAATSHRPGAGDEGLFYLRVSSVNDGYLDGIYLLDTLPPALSVSAAPAALWPANGKSVVVTVNGLATDNANGVAGTTGTYDVIDEYGLVQPSGTFTVGSLGWFSFGVPLEARRLGTDRDGRRYVIRVTVHDLNGNTTSATATVVVPLDKRK